MKQIQLPHGNICLVDDNDFDWLNQWRWCKNSSGMACRGVVENGKSKTVLIHRLIMNPPRDMQVDHVDGNRLNNCRSNLRVCTRSQNCVYRKSTTKNTSGYRGVVKHKDKWRARVEVNGIKKHLGLFENPKEAAIIYDKAAKAIFGEFAVLNFP